MSPRIVVFKYATLDTQQRTPTSEAYRRENTIYPKAKKGTPTATCSTTSRRTSFLCTFCIFGSGLGFASLVVGLVLHQPKSTAPSLPAMQTATSRSSLERNVSRKCCPRSVLRVAAASDDFVRHRRCSRTIAGVRDLHSSSEHPLD